jgi:hypothetical protein
MSIDQKYFPQDKNYLLKTVQAFSKDYLLKRWGSLAYEAFMVCENPLGLQDAFTIELQGRIHQGVSILDSAYDMLAAIYRYKQGNNQLEFIWDGRTHMEYYDEEWKRTFETWALQLCIQREVYRQVIRAAFIDPRMGSEFLQSSVKRTVLGHFGIKLTRSRHLLAKIA